MTVPSVEYLSDPRRVAVLLQPLRLRLLHLARQPVSAVELARIVGLSRQKVNYHVSALATAGFLRPAGTRRRRNLVERRYQASAQSYALHPSLLGPLAATQLRQTGHSNEGTCAALLRSLGDLAGLPSGGTSFSQVSRIAFPGAEAREAFRRSIGAAVVAAVQAHAVTPAGAPDAAGERWTLVLALYPAGPAPAPTPEDAAS